MKEITMSARFISGLIGLIVCYALSIYLFWDSQISINGFRIDPEHSRVTKSLYFILGRDNAKPVGVLLAFLSIHASWVWRYTAGDVVGKIWSKFVYKNNALEKRTNDENEMNTLESNQSFVKSYKSSSMLPKKVKDDEAE